MHDETKAWIDRILSTPEYRAERLATDLTIACELRREELELSYAEIARRMGVSRQRVHKLFSGTQNSTIGSLVKLALVLGCNIRLELELPPKKAAKRPAAAAKSTARRRGSRTAATARRKRNAG